MPLIAQKKPECATGNFLDFVKAKLSLRSDAALARALGLFPSIVSNLRHGRLPLGPTHLIRIHEVTGLSILELKNFHLLANTPEVPPEKYVGMDNPQKQHWKCVDIPGGINVNGILDAAIKRLELKSDRALSRALRVPPPMISNLRHNRISLGPTLLLRIHEASGISISELKSM